MGWVRVRGKVGVRRGTGRGRCLCLLCGRCATCPGSCMCSGTMSCTAISSHARLPASIAVSCASGQTCHADTS